MNRFALVLIPVIVVAAQLFAQQPPASMPVMGIAPKACELGDDVVITNVPAPCRLVPDKAGTWQEAQDCLIALTEMYPNIFLGAAIGYQADNGARQLFAYPSPAFKTDSVVSLASVSKPATYVGLIKAMQDHRASPDCHPAKTARCVFPDGFQTKLTTALQALDLRNGTDVVTRWWNAPFTSDPAFAADVNAQTAWKSNVTIQHLAQMTSGFPTMAFTGYRFCTGEPCPVASKNEIDCKLHQPDSANYAQCRYAYLYHQYLSRRGGTAAPLTDACRPRPNAGPRLFDFGEHYKGDVYNATRVENRFERRYSFEPGLFGECVMLDDALGRRWVDGRVATESEVAKFYLGMPLEGAPGVQYRYSQPNLYVAAYLVEALTGQRFDDYVKTRIFNPLGMVDSSFRVTPGTSQYARLADLKRVRRFPVRTLPDLAPGLDANAAFGDDKNWDEARKGWNNRWPEGGQYSTVSDLLNFLKFFGTGMAGTTQILNAESLHLATSTLGPLGPRSHAFRGCPGCMVTGNGYFTTYMQRDQTRCQNIVVLPQMIIESPELGIGNVRLCDYQYGDVMAVRGFLIKKLASLPSGCNPPPPAASPAEMEPEEPSDS